MHPSPFFQAILSPVDFVTHLAIDDLAFQATIIFTQHIPCMGLKGHYQVIEDLLLVERYCPIAAIRCVNI